MDGRKRVREGEKHHVVASQAPLTGNPADNPGMCPDWKSNWWPFGLQVGTQSIEQQQPELQPGLFYF